MGIDRAIDRRWSGGCQRDWKVNVTRDRTEEARPAISDLEAGDSTDDGLLVDACLGGQREAFDFIVRRHQRRVYQLCYRFAGNHEDASDLAQDAFIRAYRGLRSFKGNASFSTWLYRVAVNVCLNRVGSRAPRRFVTLDAADRADVRVERVAASGAARVDERQVVGRRPDVELAGRGPRWISAVSRHAHLPVRATHPGP